MKRTKLFMANLGLRSVNYPPITPPMGMLCLAAYLRERFALDFVLVDQRGQGLSSEALVAQAVAFAPDIISLSAMTPFAYILEDLVPALRRALPEARIFLGGAHLSSFGMKALEGLEVDAAVTGEGERSFELLLEAYLSGSDYSGVPGLIWRDASGELLRNEGKALVVESLDSLPLPAYDLIDLRPYWRSRSLAQVPPRRYLPIVTSRGCPYQCIYCHRIFGKRYRAQSAGRIVEDLKYLTRQYALREIEFLDDTFNNYPQRVLDFSELAQKNDLGLRIAFPNAVRGDRLEEDTIHALVDAGTYYSACALESGSPRIQKLIHKHLDIPKFLRGVELLVKRGVLTHGLVMLGFPTETEAEMEQSISVACNSAFHTVSFFTVTPYPNTDLYRMLLESDPEKLEALDYAEQDFTKIKLNFSSLSDEAFYALQRKAWRRFYLNPKRVYRILRNYPAPYYLPVYLPQFIMRQCKGLLG